MQTIDACRPGSDPSYNRFPNNSSTCEPEFGLNVGWRSSFAIKTVAEKPRNHSLLYLLAERTVGSHCPTGSAPEFPNYFAFCWRLGPFARASRNQPRRLPRLKSRLACGSQASHADTKRRFRIGSYGPDELCRRVATPARTLRIRSVMVSSRLTACPWTGWELRSNSMLRECQS